MFTDLNKALYYCPMDITRKVAFARHFIMHLPFSVLGHIVSLLSVHPSVHPVHPADSSIRTKNGFCSISFERLVYWIHVLYTGI